MRTGIKRIFSMTQQLIIDALRNRIESGPVRCHYGDWIVVYKGCEIARWDHHLNVLVVGGIRGQIACTNAI